ncbi:MAG: succinate dehydrogenase iron-sulfur subunit [Deltaproteobacteria bacterium]
MEVHFKIFRYDPAVDPGPYYRHYKVEANPQDRILDCLNRIKWEQDGTLSYRMSCGHGVCGSDGMRINGTCGLACQKIIKDYTCPEIVLEPLPVFRVLKDLVVDMDSFLEGINAVKPYLIPREKPDKEILQSPEDRKKVDEVVRCILCACCTASCPVMGYNKNYVGPAALVWMYRYIFDSRDDAHEERLRQADAPNGAWPCVNHFECTRVCPKDIPVTKSINTIKREIKKALGKT